MPPSRSLQQASLPLIAYRLPGPTFKLAGKLIFIVSTSDGNNNYMDIQELDLGTGTVRTIFQSVPDGWIDSAVISPDQKQIVMTYSTPALQVGAQFTPLGLYIFPADGTRASPGVGSPAYKG